MQYFRLQQDPDYLDTPLIPNVIMQINPRNATPEQAHKIEQISVIKLTDDKQHDFLDLLDRQLFLLSDALKAVFRLYLPRLAFKTVVLLEPKNQVHQVYYLPVFQPVDCLSVKSIAARDKSIVTRLVLRQDALRRLPVCRVRHEHETIVVARLDAAESIARRRLRGIRMTRVELE